MHHSLLLAAYVLSIKRNFLPLHNLLVNTTSLQLILQHGLVRNDVTIRLTTIEIEK